MRAEVPATFCYDFESWCCCLCLECESMMAYLPQVCVGFNAWSKDGTFTLSLSILDLVFWHGPMGAKRGILKDYESWGASCFCYDFESWCCCLCLECESMMAYLSQACVGFDAWSKDGTFTLSLSILDLVFWHGPMGAKRGILKDYESWGASYLLLRFWELVLLFVLGMWKHDGIFATGLCWV